MSQRNLHECPVCKEWFNTTGAIMIEHYRTVHPQEFKDAVDALKTEFSEHRVLRIGPGMIWHSN